jgi:hypothetical protein
MANRFLETNYYKSPFVRSLRGAIKGLYSFIICDCTTSGIWAKDMEAASMYIGFAVSDEDFNENFVETGKAIELGGNKYFFPDFIEHQYPKGLQENNAAHKNVIFELKKYDLLDEKNQVKNKKKILNFKDPLKPLNSSFNGSYKEPKDMDKEKDMVMDMEKEKENIKRKRIEQTRKIVTMPFNGNFEEMWDEWKQYRLKQHEFKYKSYATEQAALMELTNIGKDEPTCIAIIKQSMAYGWKGFFAIKNNLDNGKQKSNLREEVQAEFNKRYGNG